MKPQSLDAAYERRAMKDGLVKNPVFEENKNWKDKVDWEATYDKNIDHFWNWAIESGYGKNYIIENQGDLEDMWIEYLDDKDIVWEKE